MNYTIYDPDSGEIIKNISCSDIDLLQANLDSHAYITDWYDSNQFYISNNAPVPKPMAPYCPWLVYTWNIENKTWQIDSVQSETKCRLYRNMLLTEIDRVNPVWYASLSADQQQELQAYRVALLGVPQQAGFPTLIEWPTKPQWL